MQLKKISEEGYLASCKTAGLSKDKTKAGTLGEQKDRRDRVRLALNCVLSKKRKRRPWQSELVRHQGSAFGCWHVKGSSKGRRRHAKRTRNGRRWRWWPCGRRAPLLGVASCLPCARARCRPTLSPGRRLLKATAWPPLLALSQATAGKFFRAQSRFSFCYIPNFSPPSISCLLLLYPFCGPHAA